jgi:glycosyltransferase involved in cell wall biosynthesis
MKKSNIKFSFLTIVFNGDDFLHESLASVYNFAHEIFVIEGAEKDAWSLANSDGSSTDNTNKILSEFPDPNKKIKIIHGKWKSKEEMTNAPMKYITGDFIWRLDSDEVYKEKDLIKLSHIIAEKTEVTHLTFLQQEFYKGFKRIMIPANNESRYLYDKIWKFEKGSYFVGHRPPDLFSPISGKYMAKDGHTLGGNVLENNHNINIYHYSLITDKQAKEKMAYFSTVYLRRFGVGIPFWGLFKRIPVLRVLYKSFFSKPYFDNFRKKRSFPEMNFNYITSVWERWDNSRDAVEKEFGVTFNSKKPYVTVAFLGEHPKAMQDKVNK